ncbi:MAG: hypothetical protein ABH829_01145 [archaeon]
MMDYKKRIQDKELITLINKVAITGELSSIDFYKKLLTELGGGRTSPQKTKRVHELSLKRLLRRVSSMSRYWNYYPVSSLAKR